MSSVSFVSIFETSSSRVKGIAFHPRRSWVLISLHSGVIQIWDYRLRTLIDRFGEHDGPVRSVDFHTTQPLFVSGGDDYKVKVWNYKERRCLFTLSGHLDYIRSVQFHHEYPWILSASDDQTIRIWNWQSRQCISVLAGHGNYVMSAKFHPSEDLVVSASLDQTVRVWDISGLRKKNVTPMQYEDEATNIQNELFGSTDAVIKFVLEGHDRGVNWAAFHPTLPYIISGSDDRQIKLWRMNGTKAYEMESMRGHYNNITNVLFHPREDVMLSTSEDRSIRVWDMTKRAPLYTYKKDHDRFWITAAHPKLNLFAAGHDSGLIVFKLQRERPPYTLFRPNLLLYIRDNTLLHSSNMLRMLDLETKEEVPLFTVRKTSSSGLAPRHILSHPQSGFIIVFFSGESGNRYEVFTVPKKGQSPDSVPQNGRGGPCVGVAWVKRDRFAILSKANTIMINDIETNEVTKAITPPYPIDDLFSAHTDTLILRSEDKLTLYDVQQERIINVLKLPHVKFVIRSGSSKDSMMAVICRGAVVLTTGNLQTVCSVLETLKVKSGAWDENGTFIYSTLCHIKYILPNGDHGIVRTLDRPIYITAVKGNIVHCLDRQGRAHAPPVDTTEYTFKLALANKRFGQVSSMVKNSNLIGQAIIGYLQKKGYPEVALRFVKDEKTRFNLALECSTAHNIDIAFQSATVLNDKDAWSKLGREALKQGNHQVVEKAYQQTLDFEKLSSLYSITGNTTKLRKMLQIATVKRADANAQFHNALLLGDVPARVRVLEQAGQLSLAYMTAINHGLDDLADNIRQKLLRAQPVDENGEPEPLDLPPRREGKLLLPPIPVFRLDKGNWPVTRVTRGPLDDVVEDKEVSSAKLKLDDLEDDGEAGGAGWGEEGGLDSDGELGGEVKGNKSDDELGLGDEKEGEGWDGDELEDVSDDEPVAQTRPSSAPATASLPNPGPSRADLWVRSSNLAAYRVASGKFDDAMTLLNQQLGIVNFAPLKEHFLSLYKSTSVQLFTHPSLPSLCSYIGTPNQTPRLLFNLPSLVNQFKTVASRAFTDGKFSEAKRHFLNIIQSIPLVVVDSQQEESELRQLINVCKEYLIGLNVELNRKDIVAQGEAGDQVRVAELAAYFTHCDLLVKHLQLTLKVAINTAAKVKNYLTVQDFANRLIDTNPPRALAEHAEKALKLSQSKGGMNQTQMNYDPRNPFVLCCQSLTPIYQGSPSSQCPFCQASYQPKFDGTTCAVCNLSVVGRRVAGIHCVQKDAKPRAAQRESARDSDGW